MGEKESSGFDRMSKLADSDDVFEDTFSLEEKNDEKEEEEKDE
jgi:hypothetical protein